MKIKQSHHCLIFKFWLWSYKFDLEGQGQSTPKTIGILTKVFYTYCPNLVTLAWTGNELSRGQTWWRMDGRTDRQTQATTIPKGQNWPRVKKRMVFILQQCPDMNVALSTASNPAWSIIHGTAAMAVFADNKMRLISLNQSFASYDGGYITIKDHRYILAWKHLHFDRIS